LDLAIVAAIENSHNITQKQSAFKCHVRIAMVGVAQAASERNDLRKDQLFHPLVFACFPIVG
jgi:hypothetical protein